MPSARLVRLRLIAKLTRQPAHPPRDRAGAGGHAAAGQSGGDDPRATRRRPRQPRHPPVRHRRAPQHRLARAPRHAHDGPRSARAVRIRLVRNLQRRGHLVHPRRAADEAGRGPDGRRRGGRAVALGPGRGHDGRGLGVSRGAEGAREPDHRPRRLAGRDGRRDARLQSPQLAPRLGSRDHGQPAIVRAPVQ